MRQEGQFCRLASAPLLACETKAPDAGDADTERYGSRCSGRLAHPEHRGAALSALATGGRPFFIVTRRALRISRLSRHFRQYPVIGIVPLVSSFSDVLRRPRDLSLNRVPYTVWHTSWPRFAGTGYFAPDCRADPATLLSSVALVLSSDESSLSNTITPTPTQWRHIMLVGAG